MVSPAPSLLSTLRVLTLELCTPDTLVCVVFYLHDDPFFFLLPESLPSSSWEGGPGRFVLDIFKVSAFLQAAVL